MVELWRFKTPGIPDEMFERTEKVPITKEEVRAVQISKARLMPGYTVYDVGCGSGSVTVEAALQVESSGKVVGIDYDENAIKLTETNAKKFGLSNVSLVLGNATEKMKGAEPADAVFVGGTGKDTAEIVKLCSDVLRPGGRIVIGTILIETLYGVLRTLEETPFESVDITQVTVAKSRKTSTGTMMLARNPVTIVSATRRSMD